MDSERMKRVYVADELNFFSKRASESRRTTRKEVPGSFD